ncbi:MAG: MarR family transcriptional regulator [Rhizobiaceae bacterium]|nr:MarR family transcriptional regulator [Rhizobiaceae bacterium]MCV0408020.1 MarR family transcriptional regulator [Rhizobiaceae bacterium]
MKDLNEMPGHLARRFQQIAVAVFHASVAEAGHDLTPVQYAALSTVKMHPGIDQATLAGLIAYDQTTIGGVVDRLVGKGLIGRRTSGRDRRARELTITKAGEAAFVAIEPAVEAAQKTMLQGLTPAEAETLLALLRKAIDTGNDLSRAPMRGRGDLMAKAVGGPA